MHVSLIATVKNEAGAIGRLLDSISAQTRLPDELVIADGGSHDRTVALIEAWGARQPFAVRVLSVPGANISQGRNAAIRAATGDIIASTDAGVRLDGRWLEKLVEPLEWQVASDKWQVKATDVPPSSVIRRPSSVARQPSVVSGFFVPDARNAFEMAMSATVLPTLGEVNPETFLPSSRSIAFAKPAWEAVNGYPEWLDYCEDLAFDFALRRRFAFAFAPEAVAYFRPRGNLRSFFRQYYLYARGDGKADLWRKRQAIRYLTYLVGAPLLVALALWHSPLWWLVLLIGAALYLRTPYRRLSAYLPRLSVGDKLYALALVPVIRVTGDVAKMLGYPVGVWWRLRRGRA